MALTQLGVVLGAGLLVDRFRAHRVLALPMAVGCIVGALVNLTVPLRENTGGEAAGIKSLPVPA